MTRSIDNFLTKEEQNMILRFIETKEKRRFIYNEKTGGLPPALDMRLIEILWKKKNDEWNSCLKGALVPNTGISYRQSIEKNNIDCAIKNFLITFKSMLDEELPVFEYKSILEDLDTGVSICGASCPCPTGERVD